MAYFNQIAHSISPKSISRVKSITIRLCVTDCIGTVYFTDLLLQAVRFPLDGSGMYAKSGGHWTGNEPLKLFSA